MAKKRTPSGYGTPVSADLKKQIIDAMGSPKNTRLVSVRYVGRDSAGQPKYSIRYEVGSYVNGKWRSGSPAYPAVTRTMTLSGGKLGTPQTKPSGVPSSSVRAPASSELDLEREKDRALQWLARLKGPGHPDSQISQGDLESFTYQIVNWGRDAKSLHLWVEKVLKPNIPFGHIAEQNIPEEDTSWMDFLNGIGFGGDFAEPVYKAPDRRVIEDMAKGMMVSLVGGVMDDRLKAAVDLYMKDHRRNWDSDSQEINPEQSLLAYIREQPEYEQIHALRPEGSDERSWISNRANLAKQGGLNSEDVDQFAIDQATVGGDEGDMLDAAASTQYANTGSAKGTTLMNKMREQAVNVFRNVAI